MGMRELKPNQWVWCEEHRTIEEQLDDAMAVVKDGCNVALILALVSEIRRMALEIVDEVL